MNPRLLIAGAVLLGALVAQSQQPDPIWTTTNNVLVPPQPYAPQINAVTFLCNKKFILNNYSGTTISGGGFYVGFETIPFRTSNTLNWTNTNTGILSSLTGFDFQTWPDGEWDTGGPRMASTFFNDSTGTINVATNGGSLFLPLYGFLGNYYGSAAQLLVSATNVVNRGEIKMGPDTLLSITGEQVDLSRSALSMEGFTGNGLFSTDGMSDGYWGTGFNRLDPVFDFEFLPYWTPYHTVTNRDYFTEFVQLAFTNSNFYVSDFTVNSNRTMLGVFLNNPYPTITNRVYFNNNADEIVVEWNWYSTSTITGLRETNYLYLIDYPTGTNNIQTNGYWGGLPTAIPSEFTFYRSQQPLFYGIPASTSSPLGVFDNGAVTNEYAAYQALFQTTTTEPGQIYGQTVTNLPGRIEVTGTRNLNLNKTRINAANYLSIAAPYHFAGSSQAVIASPFLSLDLATTNGILAVSNIIVPSLTRPEGAISLWSGRWKTTTTISNSFHVLFVDSQLAPLSKPLGFNVGLRSTNVFISDSINISSNLLIVANNLTLTTNQPGAPTPAGSISLLSLTVPNWQYLAPTLQNFTNNGSLLTPNADEFSGYRYPPYYPSSYVEPYLSMVNRGVITNTGSLFWANYFVNSGIVDVGSGSLGLTAGTAYLTNGQFLVREGRMDLAANSLVISNHGLTVGNALTLGATTLLNDGSAAQTVGQVTNKNTWTVGFGFNLTNLPAASSLLATTITDSAPAQLDIVIPHVWSGRDLGANPQGYSANCAVGRLILNSAQDCLFAFAGSSVSNALYVDLLELQGATTNRDDNGDLTSLDIAPNCVIYYAQAIMNGASVAEKLNHRNNDRLRWVGTYAGYYSSTNILYPDGKRYAFNAALAASCNYDSNGNGIANCSDTTPFYVLDGFTAGLKTTPSKAVQLNWNVNAAGFATNTVYYTPTLAPANWQVLTQFVSGPLNGPVGASDAVGKTNRFYRVTVSVQQP